MVPDSSRDVCSWTVTVLIFSLHYLLNPILQKDRNLIQSLYYVKAKEKQGSPGLVVKVFCCNAKTAAFQLCNNFIFPFLQLEKIKSPVVCVILLHTESMILLEAKRLFFHRSVVTAQTCMLCSLCTPRFWL